MALRLNPDDVDTIVIHITDSSWGDVAAIDQWHKERGWEGIGYHFVITNCFPTRYTFEAKRPDLESDGMVHNGRDIGTRGAHVKGENWHSVGVALVGRYGIFTSRQIESAIDLVQDLKERFPNVKYVKGHFEFNAGKTCPELDMDLFRRWVDATE